MTERGSASLEAVLLAPVLLLLLMFVVFAGRVATAGQDVRAAARDAARAASLTTSSAAAERDARVTAAGALAATDLACARLSVEVDTARLAPGGDVAVEVTCTLSMRELAGLAVPGAKTIEARSVAVVDVHRGTP